MSETNSCVAIYDLQQKLEESLESLRNRGCDLHRVSVVGKGGYSGQEYFALYTTAGRVRFHGSQCEFWNRVYALLGSAGCFWVPDYGPFAVAGPVVTALMHKQGMPLISGQLRKLGSGLYAIGVTCDNAQRYESLVGQGRLLLIVQGSRDEVEQASDTIAGTQSVEMAVHVA